MSDRRRRSAKQFEVDYIDRTARWLFGVIPEIAVAAYGLHCVVTRHAVIPGRGPGLGITLMPVEGVAAVGVGVACLGFAAFGHFHFYWEGHPKLTRYAETGKLVSLAAMSGGIVVAVMSVLVLG